jgi:hypothetical protein
MKSHRFPLSRPAPRSAFAGYRFPPEIITLAVRWYLRFGLSYRDVEELLAERGVEVDHVTIYRWVQRFAPEFAEAARARQHLVGDRWHVDETYLKVGGTWRYLFRAIDQFGQVIDVFLSLRRNRRAHKPLIRLANRPAIKAKAVGGLPGRVPVALLLFWDDTSRPSVLGAHRDRNEDWNRIIFAYAHFEDGLRSLPEDDAHLIDCPWRCVHHILDPDG